MKNKSEDNVVWRIAVLLLVAVGSLAAGSGPARATAAEALVRLPAGRTKVAVPIHRGGNLMFVDAQINGQDVGFFVVDTGASATSIARDVADRLKLQVVGEGIGSDISGTHRSVIFRAKSMRIGDENNYVTMGPVDLYASDLQVWRAKFGPRFAGLLGGNAWQALPFQVNYRKQTVTFYDREHFAPPKPARKVLLTVNNGTAYVPATVNKRIKGLVMLDTGFEGGLYADNNFVAQHAALFDPQKSVVSPTDAPSGSTRLMSTFVDEVSLFGRKMSDIPVVYNAGARQEKSGRPVEQLGVFGARDLRNFIVTFDYQGGRLWATWQKYDPRIGASGDPVDLNVHDFAGMTPLIMAVKDDDTKWVVMLLKAGADPNGQDRNGFTPLRWAAQVGSVEIVKTLLAAKADPDSKDSDVANPLMMAVLLENHNVAKALLAGGANVDAGRRADNLTALMVAAQNGKTAGVKLLLDSGADVNVQHSSGSTAITFAEDANQPQIAEMLTAAAKQP